MIHLDRCGRAIIYTRSAWCISMLPSIQPIDPSVACEMGTFTLRADEEHGIPHTLKLICIDNRSQETFG